MRKILLMSIGLAALGALASSHAQSSEERRPRSLLNSLSWDRVQGHVAFSTRTLSLRADPYNANREFDGARPSSVALVGSYYLSTPLSQLSFSGLRATSGLMLGQRSPLWGIPGFSSAAFSGDRRRGGTYSDPYADASAPNGNSGSNNTPYLGIGYTGLGGKGNWGFSADLGLISLNPGSIVRLGRVFNGSQNLDDMVRDLRLAPVLQLGISYSF